MKTVLFALLDQYADWEGAYLAAWLTELGQGRYCVRTLGLTRAPIRSIGGFTTLPDYTVSSAPVDFAGLILIGGKSWRTGGAKRLAPLVERAAAEGRVLGGICDGAAFLGTLGVLNRADHTANDLDDLKQWAGAAYTGEARFFRRQAVRDSRLVTANGTAALEFAREVLLALEAAPADRIQELYEFHKRGFAGTGGDGA